MQTPRTNILQTINLEYDKTHGHNIFIGFVPSGLHLSLSVTDEFCKLPDKHKRTILRRLWTGTPYTCIRLYAPDHRLVCGIDKHMVTIYDENKNIKSVYGNKPKR